MQLGLKNRLRIISLLPIIIIFSVASYFAYKSFLHYTDESTFIVQADALSVLIISLIVLVISIIIGIFGYILSNEMSNNLKNLEKIFLRVANDIENPDKTNIEIDLHSSKGRMRAYKLLESIIDQTREDKISAQEASEAKSMFLANMSHEIRTPLNGIVGFTELLKDSGLQEEQSEFVDIIEKSSENLLEIINNILDLSKVESNKLEIEDIVFNPIEEFESAVEVYSVRASEKHIDLGCFVDPQLEKSLKGDPTKLKEVIINLLSNAVKFTSSSGAINVNIRKIDSDKDGFTKVRFEIQDSGIGVTSEQKGRIFEAFSQADTSITRKYGGTGLGLTISSSFVAMMGGKLDLHSEPSKGTTFFFTLDFEEVENLNEISKGNFTDINALILEDSHKQKRQTKYLKEYLDFLGVNYAVFKDLQELENIQSKTTYDLLFIDYDYCSEAALIDYSAQPQKLVVMTKSTYKRKLDSLDIDVFKMLYEPLNHSKVKSLFKSFSTKNIDKTEVKTVSLKNFDADTSKFDANVLIAEDNIINQKLIKRTLEDIGLTVTIASNGLDAFQKRKDGNFDLIFMDIQMPFLDGVEATKEILEYEKDYNQTHVPIIALTANALKGDRERFLEEGLDEYTTKPLVRAEIVSLLNNFLAEHIIEVFEEENVTDNTSIQEDVTNHKTQKPPKKEAVKDEDVQDINLNELEVNKQSFKADILLIKNSSFEAKLFSKLLASLGYTFEIATSMQELDNLTSISSYKIIIFDEECEGLNIEEFSKSIKISNEESGLKTNLILISDQENEDDENHNLYVQETIKNVVNKDSLKLVFEKYI